MTGDALAREAAAQGLEAALVEQDRLGEHYRAALGTSSEFGAYARLRNVSDEVETRRASLAEVEDGPSAGRVWVNGREVGGADPRFPGLEDSHD